MREIYNVSRILRNERIYRKLSQDEMAKHIGISRSTLSLIENGAAVNFKNVQKYVLTLKGLDILTTRNTERVSKK